MFINCPYCNALVATDPATDAPPERCPRCSAELRGHRQAATQAEPTVEAPAASDGVAGQVDMPMQDTMPPAEDSHAAIANDIKRVQSAIRDELRVTEANFEAARLDAARLGAVRLEVARLEAERLEAVRLEEARLEATRREATRLEAEKLEAKKLETARLEAARIEEARIEEARLEAARIEEARLEAAKLEEEARVNSAKLEEEARLEAAKLEEEARLEAARLPGDDDVVAVAATAELTAADSVAEAMLGPGAIEVEIAGAMPDEAHGPSPAHDAAADAQPSDAIDADASDRHAKSAGAPPRSERRSKAAPSFVRAQGRRAARRATRGWRAPVAIVVLASLLALQLLVADRADLAESARWRPWIASLCDVLRCKIPPWREAQAFTLLERDVRPHPTVPGALRVTASFRNDARWPQPWPRLALTLSDVDGREAGTRRFAAAEYLGAKPAQQELGSGQTATIAMDVIEPAPHIVAFTFEFH